TLLSFILLPPLRLPADPPPFPGMGFLRLLDVSSQTQPHILTFYSPHTHTIYGFRYYPCTTLGHLSIFIYRSYGRHSYMTFLWACNRWEGANLQGRITIGATDLSFFFFPSWVSFTRMLPVFALPSRWSLVVYPLSPLCAQMHA
ncbi:hypothetical protein F5X99DRAFT_376729, partial [Biscogniauxia marginata]